MSICTALIGGVSALAQRQRQAKATDKTNRKLKDPTFTILPPPL
jgi:hypothetical protein